MIYVNIYVGPSNIPSHGSSHNGNETTNPDARKGVNQTEIEEHKGVKELAHLFSVSFNLEPKQIFIIKYGSRETRDQPRNVWFP